MLNFFINQITIFMFIIKSFSKLADCRLHKMETDLSALEIAGSYDGGKRGRTGCAVS